MKKKKHLQEKSKRSERRVWEFQGDREEERGWCFLGKSSGRIGLACGNLWCEGHPSYPVYHTPCMLMVWQRICSRFYGTKRWKKFMRGVSKRNFSSAKYGKFRWPQEKRSWSFTRAPRKKERCCADPCWDWDTFGPRWKCSFKLWMAQQCGASSWPYDELSFHSFFLGFPKIHVEVWFFFAFFHFVWVLTISLTLTTMIAYCSHKASGELGLVQIWTPNQQLPNHTF